MYARTCWHVLSLCSLSIMAVAAFLSDDWTSNCGASSRMCVCGLGQMAGTGGTRQQRLWRMTMDQTAAGITFAFEEKTHPSLTNAASVGVARAVMTSSLAIKPFMVVMGGETGAHHRLVTLCMYVVAFVCMSVCIMIAMQRFSCDFACCKALNMHHI